MLSQMFESYGRPLEFSFKQDELGSKTFSDGKRRAMRKFWSAARTTKYAQGSHFLIVEVVTENGTLAISSFCILNFPFGVPDALK